MVVVGGFVEDDHMPIRTRVRTYGLQLQGGRIDQIDGICA